MTIPAGGDLEMREVGRDADGRELALDRRLFIQLHAFSGSEDSAPLVAAAALSA